MMRRILISIAVLGVSLSLIAGPAARAASAQGVSTAAVTPASGPAGSTVTGSGANWTPGDHIQAYWSDDNSTLGSEVVVASDGTFTDPGLKIPSGVTLGSHQILFSDVEGRYFEVANFDVTTGTSSSPPPACPSNPAVAFSPSSGPLGTTFTITGSGWAPGGTVTSTLPYGSPGLFTGYQAPTVDASGGFSYKETVGTGTGGPTPPGTYVFTYVEKYGGCSLSSHQTFTVTPKPSPPSCTYTPEVTFGPGSGPVGTTFTIAGSGWAPGGTVTSTLPYGSPGWFTGYQTPTVDASGGFSYKETVGTGPHGPTPPGTYTITYLEKYGGCSLSIQHAFTVTAPPSPPKPKSCPTVLLGLHGFRQGPPNTKEYQESNEILSTFRYFKDSMAAQGHSPNDYKVWDVPYPTTDWQYLDNPLALRTIVSDVTDGSYALEAAVQHYTALCPSSSFELVGYSEGAWIVDYWLHFYQSEARSHVKAIQLYGDPNYYQAYGHDVFGFVTAYQGLSRIAGLTYGWYGPPYPAPNTPYAVQTFCIPKDPVCGLGYKDTIAEHAVQFAAAVACGLPNSRCPHMMYPREGFTERGGEFLAEHAF